MAGGQRSSEPVARPTQPRRCAGAARPWPQYDRRALAGNFPGRGRAVLLVWSHPGPSRFCQCSPASHQRPHGPTSPRPAAHRSHTPAGVGHSRPLRRAGKHLSPAWAGRTWVHLYRARGQPRQPMVGRSLRVRPTALLDRDKSHPGAPDQPDSPPRCLLHAHTHSTATCLPDPNPIWARGDQCRPQRNPACKPIPTVPFPGTGWPVSTHSARFTRGPGQFRPPGAGRRCHLQTVFQPSSRDPPGSAHNAAIPDFDQRALRHPLPN